MDDGDLLVQERTRELNHPERRQTEREDSGHIRVSADFGEHLPRQVVAEDGRSGCLGKGLVGRSAAARWLL